MKREELRYESLSTNAKEKKEKERHENGNPLFGLYMVEIVFPRMRTKCLKDGKQFPF